MSILQERRSTFSTDMSSVSGQVDIAVLDYSMFNKTYEVNMPTCSAWDINLDF